MGIYMLGVGRETDGVEGKDVGRFSRRCASVDGHFRGLYSALEQSIDSAGHREDPVGRFELVRGPQVEGISGGGDVAVPDVPKAAAMAKDEEGPNVGAVG